IQSNILVAAAGRYTTIRIVYEKYWPCFYFDSFFCAGRSSANSYYKCIKDNVVKYSKTNESADSIASAAVTSCGSVLGEVLQVAPVHER
ncbi:hypothetical protein, partial [Klebsiella aerogenes]|uniref:hypothetical protein n=1 Tax=Klebsiella aerogenes TaxID=548 RepID=UPI00197A96FE